MDAVVFAVVTKVCRRSAHIEDDERFSTFTDRNLWWIHGLSLEQSAAHNMLLLSDVTSD